MKKIRRILTTHAKERISRRGDTKRKKEQIVDDTTAKLANDIIPLYHIILLRDIKMYRLRLIDGSEGPYFLLDDATDTDISIKFAVYDDINITLLGKSNADYDSSRFHSKTVIEKLYNIYNKKNYEFNCDILAYFYQNGPGKIEIRLILPIIRTTSNSEIIAEILYGNVTHLYLVDSCAYILNSNETKLITFIDYSE